MRGKGLFKRLTAVFTALLITITALPGLEFVTAVDIDPIVHVADTPTIDGWREVFVQANNSTENAGGIWVDKSVFDTSADFDGKAITLSDENNFLVSLSAIASTKSITGYSYIPTDTVLVLDISGSMFSRTTDRSVATSSKAARMIEAANEAIKSLLANNNNNRVGVILYSSSGMEFLPIDRYSVADPKTDNYLEYELETTRMYGTVYYTGIDLVTGDTLKDGNGTRVNKEQDVTGGTYIQAGIEFAGDYLTSTDTTVDGGSFQAGVTRMPIIVLMSDGAATYGTANYTNVTDGSRGGPGSGSGNAGLAFVNQLTAVYTLKRIEEHYGRSALLYTLGVGVNSSEYAMSVLNPSSPNASDDVADLWELYDGLKNNATLSVDLGGSNSEQSVSKYRPATADGFTISSADRFYVDRYFAASTASDITAAFKSIVDQIIIQSKYYPTYVSDGDHHLDGEITFKDEIGRYMEVKEIKGILLGNVLFSGEAVAKAMNEGDLGTIQQATPLGDELSRAVQKRIGVDVKTAQFLIDEAYKAGQLHYNEETGEYSNYIGWYAYADGSYAGFWNGDEKMSDRPANAKYANRSYGFLGVTGSGINASNMMYISVQVHTNIDTNFSAVIFRIPSALIPLISYEVSLEGDSYESAKNIQVTRTDANPIRLVYEVGLRSDVNELTIKDVVDENYPYVDNNGVYSFYTNRWVTDAQQHEEGHHPSEHLNTVAYYTPSEENERYYYTENNIVYSDMSGTKYTGSDHPATTGDTYYRAYYVFSNTANKNGIEVKYEEIHRDNEVTHSTLHQAEWDEENGYWYIPKGYIHRTTGSFYVGKPQNDNNSGTYDFVRQPVVGMHSGTFYATAFLGNNGLLTLEPAQGIKLSKTIEGTPVPGTNTQFTFNIESANASENESYRVIRFDAQGNETTESIQFTAGKATIDLNNGDTVYILDLNEGDKFTITEADNEDYRVMSVNGDETAADIEVTVVKHEIADADFVNTYIPKGLLVVSKTVEHTLSDEFAIDAEREYEITVSLGTGLAGDELNAVIKNADGTTKNTKVTVDADGNIKLLLVHGSNIAIEDIPAGTVYSVSEADYSADGFITAIDSPNGTIVADDNSYVNIVNTYSPDGVDLSTVIHTGTKAIDGRDWLDTDTFEFVLEKFTGTGYTKVGESINVTYSDVLDEIAGFGFDLSGEKFTDIGEYRYKIRETAGDIGGITYTDKEYEFTVTVTDETMDGKLEIASVTSQTATVTALNDSWTVETPFTNTYKARGGAEVSVTVNKVIENDDGTVNTELSREGYKFGIYDANGSLIDTLVTEANGVTTSVRTYTADAIGETHTYVIREINTGVPGVVYSQDEYEFTVTIVDNLDGTVGADIKMNVATLDDTDDIPGIQVGFVNIYKPAAIVLEGTKLLNNRDMVAGEFDFEVKEGNTVVATGKNTADGRIVFTEIDYNDVGTHNYTISEVKGDNATITYDDSTVNVTVNVTANADGSLIASLADNSPEIKFENTYNLAPTTIVLKGTKTLTGKTLTDGAFTFTVYEGEDEVAEGTNAADGTITFDEIEYTAAGTHTYTITEVNGGKTIDGITYDDSEITITVNVVDNGDGTLTASVDATSPAIKFENEYNVGKTSITLKGTKTLTGKTLTDGAFTFTVYEGEDEVSEGTNAADGTITFEAIEYTKAGTHTYTVTEVNGGQTIDGITYDDSEITVTVNVVDNGDGTLTASVDANSPAIAFQNEYNVGKTSITLKGTKTLTGKTLADNQFSFVVMEGTTKVSEGTNAADGTITFDEIEYTKAGTHTYTITEVNGGETIDGITYDADTITVTVNVVDNGDGTLTASVDANSPAIAFQNEYNVGKTSITLKGTKTLTGKTLADNQFSFVVMEGTTKVSEGTNEADGTVTFDEIEYTKAGTHTYTVTEVNGGETIDGITYDDSEITITVNVVDNGDGTLTASVDANSPAIAFQNEYNVGKTSITLEGTKTLTGKTLADNQFSFVVMEGATKVSEGTNEADGTVTFDEIEYTKAGTHTYVISEVNGGETIDGITYDDSEITITVNVVDNGDGTLTASLATNSPAIAFQNEYNVGKTSITLEGAKTLTGKTLTDGAFTFTVYEGATKVSEGTNEADGTITFDEIEYTAAGTHTYTITEVNGGETIDGITYDDSEITVTVNVVDNGDGTLTASVDANSPAIKFENEYNVGKTSITLEGTKTLTGKTLTDGTFTFTVYEGTTKVSEGTNAADGTITFEAIEYTKAGTHTYTVTEVNGGETIDGITYDDSEITVTVNVVDNGDGTLTASVDATSPAIKFENEYNVGKTSITLKGTKTLTGKTLTDGAFTFTVYEGATKVSEGTNEADGTITFEAIEYTKAGTHTYTITEVNGDETIDGITYDDSEITVTVNVVDNGDGTLTASVDATSPDIKFENEYNVGKTSITLEGTKALTGKTLTDNQFSFVVMEGATKVSEGTNEADGTITFEAIEYTKAGTHTYTITEVNGGETIDGITYDDSEITVTVNVIDNGDGTLTASVDANSPAIAFQNEYNVGKTSITLEGTKTLTGKTLTDNQFSFVVMEGATKVSEGTNAADGTITFEAIEYTKAGTHTYVISEVNGGETIDGITYDADTITVTVNVVDNGDGTLTASVSNTSPAIKFENEYNVGKTSITLKGTKTLTGKTLADNQFSFVVMEGTTKVSEGTNAADGTITFDEIEYTAAGTHTYTVTEVNGGETIDGIT
ncbi:MAG: hypothetical protein IJ424_09210, partial [Oscillospiraceae bacterium]|nr:hypothetical protein [Oscillospiraceae bacterium]